MVHEAVGLSKLHDHWRILKLAGVYAAADERSSISSQDIIEAISFSKLLDGSLQKFIDLSKREHYEILIDNLKVVESLTIHELKKKEIISGRGSPDSQVRNLVDLANSKLGKEGMLEFTEGIVSLKLFKEVKHGASYIQVSGTKDERAFRTRDGYTYKKTKFEKLANIISNDTAYCSFEFRDGVRSNDNIISGSTFIVLDIDDSDITYTEAHDMLQDYNHHIAKTSDEDNPYKFRALLELDIEVDLDARLWKPFMDKVGKHLGLELDLLAKSQIYYGFKGREVLSTLDGDALPASDFIKNLEIVEKPVKRLTQQALTKVLDDAFDTFSYAYEYKGNWGGVSMYRAFKHLQKIGGSQEQVIHLLKDICDYRSIDFNLAMKRTGILNQIERSYLV